ncbi:hypothetical protein G6F68_020036 [Rhizopus microsporus]|nr:hypothetical protein G6F68_020036 [Rhizopus microsporus]
MNVLDYTREYYGYQNLQQQIDGVPEEEDTKETHNEEEGDLSSQHMKQSIQFQLQKRPEFEPLRGSVLVKEVTDNLIKFLIEFMDSYIILPEDPLNGIDL